MTRLSAHRVPSRLTAFVAVSLLLAACAGSGSPSAQPSEASESSAPGSMEASAEGTPEETSAAEWPTGTVTIIVGAAPGTANDLTARLIADLLSETTGATFVVENQTAGTGAEMMASVAQADADGHTLGLWSASSVSVLASEVIPYGVDDFEYIVQTTGYPLKFCVKEDSDIASMEDFIERAESGEDFLVGGPYTGSLAHLTAVRFADVAGIDFTWVPFDGAPEVYAALLGDQVDIAFLACRGIEGTRNLAVTTPERQAIDPETPTLMELGYDFQAVQWLGLVTTGGTDEATVERIQELVIQATEDPEFAALAESQQVEISIVQSDEFRQEVEADTQAFADLQERLGL